MLLVLKKSKVDLNDLRNYLTKPDTVMRRIVPFILLL